MLHVDLFAGAGGFSAGVRAAGFQTVAAVEHDPVRCQTLRANFADMAIIQADIRQLSGWDLIRQLPRAGGRYREPDLLTASPPCGPFSPAGSRSRTAADDRVWLFREVVRLAVAVQARVVLIENVPRFTSHRVGPDLVADLLRRDLDAAGYRNRLEAVLDAADYGVPQHRRRWFMLASRDNAVSLLAPEPTTAGCPVTVGEAFADLPEKAGVGDYKPVTSGYADLMRDHKFWRTAVVEALSLHTAARPLAARLARYSLVRPGRRVADLLRRLDPAVVQGLEKPGVLPAAAYKQSGQRLHRNRPSPTVPATAADRILHPKVNRAITVREAARLQSFPDGYDLAGGSRDQYRQVGDAIPPLLAWRWAGACPLP